MVVLQHPEQFRLVRFEVDRAGPHKYKAVLRNKTTGTERRVPFGAKKKDGTPYQHYHDKIGHYRAYDHKDKERRDRYRVRHRGQDQARFSSGWFSWKFLW
jgi:hypothetical protein